MTVLQNRSSVFHDRFRFRYLLVFLFWVSSVAAETFPIQDSTQVSNSIMSRDSILVNDALSLLDSCNKLDTLDLSSYQVKKSQKGKISYYSKSHQGARTASGERHRTYEFVAAHRTLPFGTLVKVKHGDKSVVVRINDRGPFGRGMILDISYGAAKELGILAKGVIRSQIEVLEKVDSATLAMSENAQCATSPILQ